MKASLEKLTSFFGEQKKELVAAKATIESLKTNRQSNYSSNRKGNDHASETQAPAGWRKKEPASGKPKVKPHPVQKDKKIWWCSTCKCWTLNHGDHQKAPAKHDPEWRKKQQAKKKAKKTEVGRANLLLGDFP